MVLASDSRAQAPDLAWNHSVSMGNVDGIFKTLRNFDPPASGEEVRAASL